MDHFAHLWLFFLMVLGIIVLPGMDMAFVMASSLTGGRKAGLFAVAGIVAGGVCHVVAGALGLGILLQLVPGMVNVLLLAGSLYIAWIGWSLMRSTSVFGALPDIEPPSPWRTFRQAALTCLLNPKAYLFMLAIFPQFLRLEYGSLWAQAVALGLIIAVTQTGVYGSLALAAAGTRQWLAVRPGASVAMARMVGTVLIAGAVFTAWQGWRQF
jgi:threonine/homoserine/homoserine lactone efflux protein